MIVAKPNTHRRVTDATQLSSWAASAVWTHRSAVVTKFTIIYLLCCWADKTRQD